MIRLFLMGQKGLIALRGLSNDNLQRVESVVVAGDSSVQNDYLEEIKSCAKERKIPCYLRQKAPTAPPEDVKLLVAISWKWMIDSPIELIVFHDSLLPKYRGFNPLVSALLNGDTEVGVTALVANQEFDRGPILGQERFSVKYPIKIAKAIELMSAKYAALLNKILNHWVTGALRADDQNEAEASYSVWRDEDDYDIDWRKSASEIKRQVDSLGFPYNGAKTDCEGRTIRIVDASEKSDVYIENRTPGKVMFMDEGVPVVICGQGLLALTNITDDDGNAIRLNKFRTRFKTTLK